MIVICVLAADHGAGAVSRPEDPLSEFLNTNQIRDGNGEGFYAASIAKTTAAKSDPHCDSIGTSPYWKKYVEGAAGATNEPAEFAIRPCAREFGPQDFSQESERQCPECCPVGGRPWSAADNKMFYLGGCPGLGLPNDWRSILAHQTISLDPLLHDAIDAGLLEMRIRAKLGRRSHCDELDAQDADHGWERVHIFGHFLPATGDESFSQAMQQAGSSLGVFFLFDRCDDELSYTEDGQYTDKSQWNSFCQNSGGSGSWAYGLPARTNYMGKTIDLCGVGSSSKGAYRGMHFYNKTMRVPRTTRRIRVVLAWRNGQARATPWYSAYADDIEVKLFRRVWASPWPSPWPAAAAYYNDEMATANTVAVPGIET